MDNPIALIELFGSVNICDNWLDSVRRFIELISQVPGLPLERVSVTEIGARGPFAATRLSQPASAGPLTIKTVRITRFDRSEPSLSDLMNFLHEQGFCVIEVEGYVVKDPPKSPCIN